MPQVKPARPVARGRLFFANPGPTNIPDSVLLATARASMDFNDPAFLAVYDACVEGLKKVLKTKQHLFMYTASGHGAWEASLVNTLSSGDHVLIPETGHFSDSWAKMAKALGLRVTLLEADWRRGIEMARIREALAADTSHDIKAVCCVHNETAAGTRLPVEQVRAILDEVKHPALLMADTISSLGCFDFRMDEWGVDVCVGGSQKGLMLPTGFSFTGASEKAMAAHRASKHPRHYFDWTEMLARRQKSFVGTVPVTLFYGLQEALRLMLDEEGLDNVFSRHARLAKAVRACVNHWSGNNGPQLFCQNPERASDSVTAVLMPEGHDAEKVRKIALERFNVSTGGGLNKLGGKVFRIGHLGDLNEPMILGTLGAVEMALSLAGVPHAKGGVQAAMDSLASS
ncbi:aminotransferase class V-fold PLP-dependent enzyme [Roseococcus sp. MDT2-1-1]|uniref:Aminotransferase class V-fold PLP-dependent enzyme n=2 Tax=Sabulicella glaciei TaxID=2984948 RepID=A0ABT3P1R3_9PROT|nr:aminotransferase class V-fold PLP-dependent enzyme [Roseococcus sp. MDT2-1-1]MCW8088365.1 aminotransferase class V-fold PLP-dependent enzyme [Roseococcus sp. MDT2-1-1]